MSRSSRVRVVRVVFVGFLVALLVKWAPLDFSVARKGTAPAALQARTKNRPELSESQDPRGCRFGQSWSCHDVICAVVGG